MLHLLGIRHHGPGSARSVLVALDELQPDVVLVEAPFEATKQFGWVGGGLEPPVALLAWVRAQPQRAMFAPFARFSPEWQAVAWANANEVPVEAIDLPAAVTLAVDADDAPMLLADGRPADPIAALAAAAGDPDPERWWDDVIEHRGEGLAAFAAVAEAMAAVRDGSVTSRRELQREAHMRKRIRAALKQHDTVAVVCGAWHVPALHLDGDLTPTVTADTATLRGLPKERIDMSWVPWTHERLARASGYGAGVRSPGWYAHVFDHPGEAATARFFVEAGRALREVDLPASPEHLIAATRTADALATMRHRPYAGLDEILDAADTVMGGLPVIRDRLVVGRAIGTVPDDAPQVPLARDIAARQKSARLKPSDDDVTVELDVRTPNGRRRSHLLHQMNALGVPWGVVVDGRGSSGTFRETWELSWRPDTAIDIIERAGYGTTLEHAAANRLIERTASETGVVELARSLDLALLADLRDAVQPIVDALATRAATDPDVVALMAALVPLAEAQRYGDVRDTDAAAVASVFDGMVVRVLAGLNGAARSLDDDAAALFVERLSAMRQALALVDHRARRRGFPEVVAQLADGRTHGIVQGRATRVLHDSDVWTPELVAARLGRALSGGTPPAVGAGFVEGFVAGSGTVLLHDAGLRDLVDGWLSALRPAAFDEVIPLLRRTFGGFDPAERRQLGQLLAGDEPTSWPLVGDDVDLRRLLAVSTTVRHMLGLPT